MFAHCFDKPFVQLGRRVLSNDFEQVIQGDHLGTIGSRT